MKTRRIVQGISLSLFLIMLGLTAYPLAEMVRVDLFLRMDPLVFIGTIISGRTFPALLLPALIIAALTVLSGRFFCSSICPLGATIDMSDRVLKKPRKRLGTSGKRFPSLSIVKYLLLSGIIGAAFAGISLVYPASPLSLATRLYGLGVYPAAARLLDLGLSGIREAGYLLGVPVFEYAAVSSQGFFLAWLTVIPVIVILGLGIMTPRFWCRYLCPAGAIFAVLSRRPPAARRVSDACNGCGACRKACPMDAIMEDPRLTRCQECIACERCVDVCPEGAVALTFRKSSQKGHAGQNPVRRRAFILSALSGACAALISLPGRAVPGNDAASSPIRPPGALPEQDFLARCIRCGECMKACPTNTLQPLGFSAGITGLMSPVIIPRIGPCETSCARCGHVCPTGAVRGLSLDEKLWARIGTASLIKDRCLAWGLSRQCLVCDEVCPLGAVELKRTGQSQVPVPFVDEKRCNGCGLCEYSCPVAGASAIVVSGRYAMRMEKGSYILSGRHAGFEFEARQPHVSGEGPVGGNTQGGAGEPPPGFDK